MIEFIMLVLTVAGSALSMYTILSIGQAIGAVSNLLAPLVGASIGLLAWIHRRVSNVEERMDEQDAAIFGNERDALNEGVLIEVRNINQRLDKIQSSIDELKEENEKIRKVQREEVDSIPDDAKFDRTD